MTDMGYDEELSEKMVSLKGKTIENIKAHAYLGRVCIDELVFSDGTVLELSGVGDSCAVDSIEKPG